MAFMTYEGLKDGGTFRLDNTTATAIKADPKKILGKVVTFVANSANDGNPMVGYGAAEAMIAGVVTAIEQEETASDKFVCTVEWNNTFDNISTASTTTTAKEGVGIACDGKGGVQTSATAYNAVCLALNTGKTSCLIRVL